MESGGRIIFLPLAAVNLQVLVFYLTIRLVIHFIHRNLAYAITVLAMYLDLEGI